MISEVFQFTSHGKKVRLRIHHSAHSYGVSTNFDALFAEEWAPKHIDQVEDLLLALVEVISLADTEKLGLCLTNFVDVAFDDSYTDEDEEGS
jgi:hypothetical protein